MGANKGCGAILSKFLSGTVTPPLITAMGTEMKRLFAGLLFLHMVLPVQAGVVIWDTGIVAEKIQEHRQNPRSAEEAAQPTSWIDALLKSVWPPEVSGTQNREVWPPDMAARPQR